jgi:hypothetical protein
MNIQGESFMKKLIIIAAILPLAGCATVLRGAKDTARFESEPPGALVTVESISEDRLGPFDCVTPCEMELKRKREWNVDFELEGYKPANGVLTPKVTGGGVASGLGNVLAGGIIGIGVDAGTGANLDLRPNPLKAILAPEGSDKRSYVLTGNDDEDNAQADADAVSVEAADIDANLDGVEAPDVEADPDANAMMEEEGAMIEDGIVEDGASEDGVVDDGTIDDGASEKTEPATQEPSN